MSDTDKVKYILSHDGSKTFKAKLNELDNLHLENIGIETAMDIVKQINEQKMLLQRASTNPNFNEHEKGVIQTYIDAARRVANSLETRTHAYTQSLLSSPDPNFQEVDGGRRRRRSVRRKSVRRKSVRRRKKSVRRKKY